MSTNRSQDDRPHHSHFNLIAAAHAAMLEHGFQPEFPEGTDRELAAIAGQAVISAGGGVRDLRHLLWSSIDNDTSKDLDQIEWVEPLADGQIRVLVGVADVDARVHRGSQLDAHAQSETTSVYVGVKVFPMLPTELSEGATSLNEHEDRAALVIEYHVDETGVVSHGKASCHGVQPCATGLSERGRVAGGQGPGSAEGGRQCRACRATSLAGPGGAAHVG